MSDDLLRWPALSALRNLPRQTTVYRAVLGKVHRAASDYRWITYPPSLAPNEMRLDQRLSLGPEDRPAPTSAWRALGEAAVALKCYRSRAVDRAGRSGGIEKQILYWPEFDPAASVAAAFVLLDALATASDELWWNEWRDPRWQDRDFYLRREPEILRIDPDQLSRLIDDGVGEVKSIIPRERLAQFYAELRAVLRGASSRPAVLDDLEEPLSPAAVAALLLPFPPEQAAEISIAGSTPNSRVIEDSLANWSAVARTSEQPPIPGAAAELSTEDRRQGEQLAAALWSERPAPRHDPAPRAAEAAPFFQPKFDREPARSVEPEAPHTPLANFFDHFLRSDERAFRPKQTPQPPISEGEGPTLLAAARKALESLPRANSSDAKDRQLKVKGELIRAWLYAHWPKSETWQAVGEPRPDDRIPALLFAPETDPAEWLQRRSLTPQQTLRLLDDCILKKKRFIPAERTAFKTWLKRLAELAPPQEKSEIRKRAQQMDEFPAPEAIPTTDWGQEKRGYPM